MDDSLRVPATEDAVAVPLGRAFTWPAVRIDARWLPWLALVGVVALSFVAQRLVALRAGYGNTYYAAAVRSMTLSWKNFFFGAFDPGGFITVDKPPVFLWVGALSARIFGYSTWSMLLPSAFAGAASVGLLWLIVRRYFGTTAATIAGLVLALTPISVAVNRLNLPEPFMILALVGAAGATLQSLESRRWWAWTALAGCLVGVAFNTKMLAAWIPGPGVRARARRRDAHDLLGLGAGAARPAGRPRRRDADRLRLMDGRRRPWPATPGRTSAAARTTPCSTCARLQRLRPRRGHEPDRRWRRWPAGGFPARVSASAAATSAGRDRRRQRSAPGGQGAPTRPGGGGFAGPGGIFGGLPGCAANVRRRQRRPDRLAAAVRGRRRAARALALAARSRRGARSPCCSSAGSASTAASSPTRTASSTATTRRRWRPASRRWSASDPSPLRTPCARQALADRHRRARRRHALDAARSRAARRTSTAGCGRSRVVTALAGVGRGRGSGPARKPPRRMVAGGIALEPCRAAACCPLRGRSARPRTPRSTRRCRRPGRSRARPAQTFGSLAFNDGTAELAAWLKANSDPDTTWQLVVPSSQSGSRLIAAVRTLRDVAGRLPGPRQHDLRCGVRRPRVLRRGALRADQPGRVRRRRWARTLRRRRWRWRRHTGARRRWC